MRPFLVAIVGLGVLVFLAIQAARRDRRPDPLRGAPAISSGLLLFEAAVWLLLLLRIPFLRTGFGLTLLPALAWMAHVKLGEKLAAFLIEHELMRPPPAPRPLPPPEPGAPARGRFSRGVADALKRPGSASFYVGLAILYALAIALAMVIRSWVSE